MKKKEEVYDDEKGPLAIICLQSMAGVREPLEKAKRAWRGFADWEKESTTRTHKLIFGESFKPKKIVAPPPPPEKKGCIIVQFKPGMSDSRKIVFLVEAACEAEEIRLKAYGHCWSNELEKKAELEKLKREWKPIWKHENGPGYYCDEKNLKIEDVDVSSELAGGMINGRVIRIERRRRMKGPTGDIWGWHTGELAYGCKLDGVAQSPSEHSWGWKFKIDLIRALHEVLGVEFVEKERKPTPWKSNATHRFWAEPLYLFIRNDGEIYRSQVVPLIKKMEALMEAGNYGFEEGKENVLLQFQQIAQNAVSKFASECESHWYTQIKIRKNSVGIGRVCGQELEEYWRTEAALQLKNGFSAVG